MSDIIFRVKICGIREHLTEVFSMMDLIFVAATVAFFGLCILYTYACERL